MPGLIHAKLCTDNFFLYDLQFIFSESLDTSNFFFEQSRNFKKWYKMFVYHLTKNVFYDEMISIIRSIYVPSFVKFRDKKFFGQKNTKGVSLQNFLGPPKKKIFFNKCCRACQQESAYKIIPGPGF